MNQRLLHEPSESSLRSEEYPLTVREAAKYLGVSPQSVYLWVERKQIPHLRVMGRNIRFLKSDLETFRASFKQEMENPQSTQTRRGRTSAGPSQDLPGIQRNNTVKSHDSASGVSCAATHAECRSPEEIPAM